MDRLTVDPRFPNIDQVHAHFSSQRCNLPRRFQELFPAFAAPPPAKAVSPSRTSRQRNTNANASNEEEHASASSPDDKRTSPLFGSSRSRSRSSGSDSPPYTPPPKREYPLSAVPSNSSPPEKRSSPPNSNVNINITVTVNAGSGGNTNAGGSGGAKSNSNQSISYRNNNNVSSSSGNTSNGAAERRVDGSIPKRGVTDFSMAEDSLDVDESPDEDVLVWGPVGD
jgi:hypothetical protein